MKNILFSIILFFFFSGIKAQLLELKPLDAGSKIHFVIKNFAVNTGGDFSGIKGIIRFDAAKIVNSSFDVSVDVATIDTDSEMRDHHLKNDDYFDAEKYPTIKISSTKIMTTNKPDTYMFTGNLTIKGVAKLIKFPFTVSAQNGGYLFAGNFEIDRNDFDLGGKSMSMGDEVKISLSVFAK